MHLQIEAAAPDGLNRQAGDAGISMVGGTANDYHLAPNKSTHQENYATAKLVARFRLRIETARLVCHLSGIGGPQ
ncbi:hypothetical protein [Mesorhizobium sp. KR9-304]|uniref:hypothetical protein n=1 Tax=Mesorhizobium sp. KR9-304 TaxID=3156614 RepID=UPI0032B52F65